MNNVVDEVLAGSPRYTIKDNGGTTLYDNVQIDLKTQVTTAGTPLNKALFDSIKDDLNSRLLISNKATQAEAQAGTNDTKYMTPLKVQQKLNSLITTGSYTAGTNTVINFSNFTNAKIITLTGSITGSSGSSNNSFIAINGTSVRGYDFDGSTHTISSTSQLKLILATNNLVPHAFDLKFDLNSKTFFGNYYDNSSSVTFLQGNFSAITTVQLTLYSGATASVTIQANS